MEEHIGKTISSVGGPCDGRIAIRFTDGSHVIIRASATYDGDGDIETDETEHDLNNYRRFYLGFLSKEQYDSLNKKEAEERLENQERNEKARYLALKEKYGDGV